MAAVQIVLLLVGLATVVAVIARKADVPAPSLLVVAGLVVGLLPGAPAVHLNPEIVGLVVLPPLVYAAGEDLSFRDLRRVWKPVSVLAVGLVLASAAAVAAVIVALTDLTWPVGLLLGAILASTDPVAVSALGRRLALPAKLRALVQAESLFNDASSLILFRLAVIVAVGTAAFSAATAVGQFLLLAVGGAIVGALVGVIVAGLRKITDDPLVETVIFLVTPYLAFVAVEHVHGSGVTAVVVAAVILGALGPRLTNPAGRLQLHAVHATAVFILESVVFSLIGLQLPTLIREERGDWVLPAAVVTIMLLLVRVLWVFPLSATRAFREPGTGRPLWRAAAVVSWAGARGVVPLAAALSIPLVTDDGSPFIERTLVLVIAIAVIVTSLVMQGFTLAPLVRWAGISIPKSDKHQELQSAWLRLTQAGHAHLDQAATGTTYSAEVIERARQTVDATAQLASDVEADGSTEQYRRLREGVLAHQTDELADMARAGVISDALRRHIQHHLDLEAERLRSKH